MAAGRIAARKEGSVNQYDISGILATYSSKALHACNKKHLKEIIRELKSELDLRKIEFSSQKKNKL